VSGTISVRGHVLSPEDVHVRYCADSADGGGGGRYEAHSDNDLLVLLDTTPDQSMLDEGVAREIINRVQKLRKKAGLVPTDQITAYYAVSPAASDLARVAHSHLEYLEAALKAPFRPLASCAAAAIAEETSDVKGAQLKVVLVRGFCAGWTAQSAEAAPVTEGPRPFCSYVNLVLADAEPQHGATSPLATVLLENPCGQNQLTLQQLQTETQVVFGQQGRKIFLYDGPEAAREVTALNGDLGGRTLYVFTRPELKRKSAVSPRKTVTQARFVNLQQGDWRASVLLENPHGDFVLDGPTLCQRAGQLLQSRPDRRSVTLALSEGGPKLSDNGDVAALAGQTLFVGAVESV